MSDICRSEILVFLDTYFGFFSYRFDALTRRKRTSSVGLPWWGLLLVNRQSAGANPARSTQNCEQKLDGKLIENIIYWSMNVDWWMWGVCTLMAGSNLFGGLLTT